MQALKQGLFLAFAPRFLLQQKSALNTHITASFRNANTSVYILPKKCISTNLQESGGVKSSTEAVTTSSSNEPKKELSTTTDNLDVQTNVPGLKNFFDDPSNWSVEKVKTGRAWTKDDLRIKSNSDLHKLWYVLLKERNMLLTMEHAAKVEVERIPSPERRDKIEESMENLEEVVKERNRAYHQLETGEMGDRKVKIIRDGLGLYRRYAEIEHTIPSFMNTSFRKKYYFNGRGYAVNKFLSLLREKHMKKKVFKQQRQRHYVRELLERFPDLEDDVLKEKFPDIDIKKLRKTMN